MANIQSTTLRAFRALKDQYSADHEVTGLQIAIQQYPFASGGAPAVVFKPTTDKFVGGVFNLGTAEPHKLIENMVVLEGMAYGFEGITGADRYKLHVPGNEGFMDVSKAYVQYIGKPLPRGLTDTFGAIVKDSDIFKDIQEVDLATWLVEGFYTGYNESYEKMRPAYASADFGALEESARTFFQNKAPQQSLKDAASEFYAVMDRTYIQQAQMMLNHAMQRGFLTGDARKYDEPQPAPVQ